MKTTKSETQLRKTLNNFIEALEEGIPYANSLDDNKNGYQSGAMFGATEMMAFCVNNLRAILNGEVKVDGVDIDA